jgi:hypothetical protein
VFELVVKELGFYLGTPNTGPYGLISQIAQMCGLGSLGHARYGPVWADFADFADVRANDFILCIFEKSSHFFESHFFIDTDAVLGSLQYSVLETLLFS